MEGIDDKNNGDSNLDSNGDTEITKKYLIEIVGKFKNTFTIELPNYEDALELFNQRSKEGKNLILYEVHKSKIDGSTIKRVPVLNTSKHAERMRVLEEELKDSNPANNGTVSAPVSASSPADQKGKMTLGTMKFKIIILVAVVVGFILTLFMLNILASGGTGNISAHLIAPGTIQNFVQTTANVNYNYNHQELFSIYFLV